MRRSPEARKIRKALDSELQAASEACGQALVWSAVEEALIAQIQGEMDRKAVLTELWERKVAEDAPAAQLTKLSGEIRLLEGAIERLLRRIRTDVPAGVSLTSVKASRAARVRWDRSRGA